MTSITIRKSHLIGIIIYYGIGLFLGLLGFGFTLVSASIYEFSITVLSILGASSSSLVGSTVFYIRKLYKGCINENIVKANNDDLRSFGIILYFVFRPIFSIAFALLVLLFVKLSITFVNVSETTLNANFVLLAMLFGFFAGFASGDVLTLLENRSKKIIPEAFK